MSYPARHTGPDEPTWITDARDKHEHGIAEDDLWTTEGKPRPAYTALCGHRVHPGALASPCGPRCEHCEDVAHPPKPPSLLKRWLRAI